MLLSLPDTDGLLLLPLLSSEEREGGAPPSQTLAGAIRATSRMVVAGFRGSHGA
jgi:hypothetical protein